MPRPLSVAARDPTPDDDTLFEHGPPESFERRLMWTRPGFSGAARRAVIVAAVAWLPVVLLMLIAPGGIEPQRIGVHARYLIAAPLLVLAETVCAQRLTLLVREFTRARLVPEQALGRFDHAVTSTRRLLRSRVAESLAWLAAYATVATLLQPLNAHSVAPLAQWSPAMWWNALVSLPLLLTLIFGWLWRVALWTRLLASIARLDLQLVATHPDHAAGLGFIGQSLRAFAIVAFALATIAAGETMRQAMTTDSLSQSKIYFNVLWALGIVVLFVLPLTVFAPVLARALRRGIVRYGRFAADVARVVDARWIQSNEPRRAEAALAEPDFSATTDLYSVVSNVYALRAFPVRPREVLMLLAAVALPYVPIVLLTVPPQVIWDHLRDVLL
jgi:hypothetical protein